jgi:defect-in-organelle-trafficking protein DotC
MINKKTFSKMLLVSTVLISVSACSQQPLVTGSTPFSNASTVNSDSAYGSLQTDNLNLPTLKSIETLSAPVNADKSTLNEKDKLRVPAMRDQALSYGARAGLSWASQQINNELQADSSQLTKTYDFNAFLIKEAGDVTLLPPVISESDATYEQQNNGNILRVADTYYEIIQQARFAPVSPLWYTYLIRKYSVPSPPPTELLPKDDAEREVWKAYVDQGWDQGVQQATDIFKYDLNRLNRDYTGMIRYDSLLAQGKVSEPIVANMDYGVTGSGTDMRVNDRLYRITQDPHLNVNSPDDWKAPVSSPSPTEGSTPPSGLPGVPNQ